MHALKLPKMNIFKKNKPGVIALLVNVVFNGLLIILVINIPLQKSESDIDDLDLEILLQNEELDEIPMPSPSQPTKTLAIKKTSANPNDERLPKVQANIVEDNQSVSQDTGKAVVPDKKDTVLLTEIKQMLEVIQATVPEDSLPVAQVQKEPKPTAHQIIMEEKRNYDEEIKFYRKNYRLILNLRKVYPYVQLTKQIVEDLNVKLSTITDDRERRWLIKQTEKQLFAQFEKDVRNMTYSQGKLFLKLIARETNQSGYDIIKTYKGTIPATFWYGVGLLFQENLKVQYDSLKADTLIEKVVVKYKNGKLL